MMNREGESEGRGRVPDKDIVNEMDHLLDPQLLNLFPEHQFATSPQLLKHFFSTWLSLPRSPTLVRSLIDYVKVNNSHGAPGSSASASTSENNPVTSAISLVVAPQSPPNIGSSVHACTNLGSSATSLGVASPLVLNIGSSETASASTSERNVMSTAVSLGTVLNISSYSSISDASSSRFPLALSGDIRQGVIPQFYFPRGGPPTDEFRLQCLNRINYLFSNRPHGLEVQEFRRVTREVCRLPFISFVLFRKIVTDDGPYITRDAFIEYWVNSNMLTMDTATQIFDILKQPGQDYLTQPDFTPVIGELLTFHPGLAFLRQSGNRLIRLAYVATAVFRIFFYVNRAQNGHLTLRELRCSDLVAAMQHAEVEADINEARRYFSFKHFYVIYWKFMRLDEDGDSYISKLELTRYENQALSYKIVNRIFSQVPRRFKSDIQGKMNYEDFVYFFLAEQDKQSESSLEYWFKCIDLDGNGILTRNELEYFYKEQISRMKCIDKEEYESFDGILDRISDIIEPEARDCISLRDLKRSKLAGEFFNILFNFNKFLASDRRKPKRRHEKFRVGQEHLWAHLTEFDRYVQIEYPEVLRVNEVGSKEVSDSDNRSSAIQVADEAPY